MTWPIPFLIAPPRRSGRARSARWRRSLGLTRILLLASSPRWPGIETRLQLRASLLLINCLSEGGGRRARSSSWLGRRTI